MSRKKIDKCVMNGCNRGQEHPKSKLCKRCYAWMAYQMKHSFTVTELMQRLHKYEFWTQRLDGHLGVVKKKPKMRRVK